MANYVAKHARKTSCEAQARPSADVSGLSGAATQEAPLKPAKKNRSKKPIAALGIALVLIIALPLFAQAWNAVQTPRYDWYTSGAAGTADDPYKIASLRDYRGFVNIVNGTVDLDGDGQNECDSFAGKYVKLTSDISLNTDKESNVIDPIGGAQTGKTFDGTFDGAGHMINNYVVTVPEGQPAENLGLFGACGEGSTIKNVVVGPGARLTIEKSATDAQQIKNVGLLVGYSEGSIEGCSNQGSVYVKSDVDQTVDLKRAILNVGGLAGQCLGNVAGCSNSGTIEVYGNGTPRSLTEEEINNDKRQEPVIVMNTGGIVGCAGALDHAVDANSGTKHGLVSGCTNTGKLSLNTPSENGLDRFGAPVYAESANTGGIVGYSRGSVEDCSNSGYIRAEKGTYAAGVVGNIRSVSITVSAGAPSFYYDDGMVDAVADKELGISSYNKEASEANTIHVKNCHNTANIMGHSSPAGVVGAAGTYTEIEGCTNAASALVMGTRWNKPFPSGIVAATRGKVMYCANYGTALSGSWIDEEAGTYELQNGYYVSGIAGSTRAYEDKKYKQVSPTPEVVGCYNAGQVKAGNDMRQRGIVGDNEGDVHNNLLLENTVYNDRIAYGMYEGDDEASGGSYSNNYVISADLLKSGDWFSFTSEDKYKVVADENGTMNALSVLNYAGDRTGWNTYWVNDKTQTNNGFPVLNTAVDWELTPITDATVTLEENATYTSLVGSVPRATVTLSGVQLVQGIDFRVIPDATAVEITESAEDPTPYTATIVGIGNYAGTAAQALKYGISPGDIANCTASVEAQRFDWDPHTVTPDQVTVTTLSGTRVDPTEYTVAFDQTDPDLTENKETGEKQAINAGRYTMIIAAAETSTHFKGSLKAEFTVQAASIMYSLSAEERAKNAIPTAITYAGQQYDWESTTYLSSKDPAEQIPAVTFEYTGHPIDPSVVSVAYKGKDLVEGRDYRVMYGDKELLESGKPIPAGEENIGVKGGVGYGYIMVKNIPGGNFSNYDVMKFTIEDTEATVDLAGAEARGTGNVIYEGEMAYEPVTLWYQNQQLTEGVDYDITYTNNTSLGTAHFTATACADGPFGGTIEGTFDIVEGDPYQLYYTYDDTTMTATATGVAYSGIASSFDLVIPSKTTFAGGEYKKITYADNKYTTETATAAAGTYTVTAIGDYAFGGGGKRGSADVWVGEDFALAKAGIRSVAIPYAVETIGKFAFAGGSTYSDPRLLSQVTFSDIEYSRLTTIGEGAFQSCGNLTEFTFPAGVTTIDKAAFRVGTNTNPSKIKKLTFLAQDASLPANVSESYTFAGIGGSDEAATVQVYGYEGAAAVKKLVSDNATEGSYGTNKGMRFSFAALQEGAAAWQVATSEYVQGSGVVLVKHNAVPAGSTCLLNGTPMLWDGTYFVGLATQQEAAELTAASFTLSLDEPTAANSGDANGNGQLNIVDVQIAYDLACGNYQDFSVLSVAGWLACDFNADGMVDATDAFAIQAHIMEGGKAA